MTARDKPARQGQEGAQSARGLSRRPRRAPGPVLPPQAGSPLSLPHLLFSLLGDFTLLREVVPKTSDQLKK